LGFSECDLTSKSSQTTLPAYYADMLYTPQPKFAISKTFFSSKVSAEFMFSCITASVFQCQKKVNQQSTGRQAMAFFLVTEKKKRPASCLQPACREKDGIG
jgi:hypothetical protein